MKDFGHIQLGLRGRQPPITKCRRGRPRGSKNINAPLAPAMDISGAATSASKMNRVVGTRARADNWLWVPGEGWVKWIEISKQVKKAHDQWRHRKAMQGIKIFDGHEARVADIEECVARRRAA